MSLLCIQVCKMIGWLYMSHQLHTTHQDDIKKNVWNIKDSEKLASVYGADTVSAEQVWGTDKWSLAPSVSDSRAVQASIRDLPYQVPLFVVLQAHTWGVWVCFKEDWSSFDQCDSSFFWGDHCIMSQQNLVSIGEGHYLKETWQTLSFLLLGTYLSFTSQQPPPITPIPDTISKDLVTCRHAWRTFLALTATDYQLKNAELLYIRYSTGFSVLRWMHRLNLSNLTFNSLNLLLVLMWFNSILLVYLCLCCINMPPKISANGGTGQNTAKLKHVIHYGTDDDFTSKTW